MAEDIKNLVVSILEKGYLMTLATSDENGVWASDVIFVHDGALGIYWLSETDTRHSKAIARNPRVAGTITTSNNKDEKNVGIQFEGNAEKIEGDILEIAVKHRAKRGKQAPSRIGEILDEGESWYRITPAKIELIYESLFGFDKRVLEVGN
ncbi:MAG: pyridoxamine 5'-phosphate oxidase family protein [Candidatus Liptonbacteria bacterium]|nr:pyridoxamine 5'-phosphate oxidase family protein [Candidatus Liptonbacteria bacterium]